MADAIYTPNGVSPGGDQYYKEYERALNYRFRMTIDNEEIGAKTISGLGFTTDIAEYREGNEAEIMHKFPSWRKSENIAIERAIFKRAQGSTATYFEDWKNLQYNLTNRSQGSPSTFRRNVQIDLMGTGSENVIASWYARNCFVADIKPSGLDASGGEVVMESIMLACESCERMNLV